MRYFKLNGHGEERVIVLRERRDDSGYYLDRYYQGEWLDAWYPYYKSFITGDTGLHEINEDEANAIIVAGNAIGPSPDLLGKPKREMTTDPRERLRRVEAIEANVRRVYPTPESYPPGITELKVSDLQPKPSPE